MVIEQGSLVHLDYDLVLDSGDRVDSSDENGPLRIRIGEWDELPGLGEKLVGLCEGDERFVRLTPPEAFGEWDPDMLITMRASQLVGDAPLQDGMAVRIETREGPAAVCRVYRVESDRVALDFNHPFAGEPVMLYLRILKVGPPTPPGVAQGA